MASFDFAGGFDFVAAGFVFAAGFDFAAAGLVLAAGLAFTLAGLRLAAPFPAAPAALRAGRRVLPFAFCAASSGTAASSAKVSGSAPLGREAMTPSWLT